MLPKMSFDPGAGPKVITEAEKTMMMPVKPPKRMPPPSGTYSPSAKAQKIIGAQKLVKANKALSDLMKYLGSRNVPGTGGPNYPVGPLAKGPTPVPGTRGPNFPVNGTGGPNLPVPGTGGPNFPIPGGMKKGGMVSASKRADGCAIKGKTRGRIV